MYSIVETYVRDTEPFGSLPIFSPTFTVILHSKFPSKNYESLDDAVEPRQMLILQNVLQIGERGSAVLGMVLSDLLIQRLICESE